MDHARAIATHVTLGLAVLGACGSKASTGGEAGVIDAATIDGPADATVDAPVDAPMLPACANPVAGAKLTARKLGQIVGIGTLVTSPPVDPRLFAVGARGKIYLFKSDQLQPAPFLDLSSASGGPVVDTSSGTELGMLGLAFHPRYATNGLFYVYYTTGKVADSTLRDVVVRCHVSATDPDVADPTSCTEILSIADPAVNHNGGMMEFGADGLLYIATGDGGGTNNNSQDKTKLLGKMLRIDVDHQDSGKLYAIPADNPFAAGGALPEIFMLGLRNPWRWAFDDATGDMWIADVGESKVEEVDVLAPSEQRAANLGWVMYEGSECHAPPCDPTGMTFPKDERTHADGWAAIIGGQVYRGTCYPDLVGWYFYADFLSGLFVKARLKPDRTLEMVDIPASGALPLHPTSIHEDAHHELYITDSSGFVYHLEASP
jgi:hypothetical protein